MRSRCSFFICLLHISWHSWRGNLKDVSLVLCKPKTNVFFAVTVAVHWSLKTLDVLNKVVIIKLYKSGVFIYLQLSFSMITDKLKTSIIFKTYSGISILVGSTSTSQAHLRAASADTLLFGSNVNIASSKSNAPGGKLLKLVTKFNYITTK